MRFQFFEHETGIKVRVIAHGYSITLEKFLLMMIFSVSAELAENSNLLGKLRLADAENDANSQTGRVQNSRRKRNTDKKPGRNTRDRDPVTGQLSGRGKTKRVPPNVSKLQLSRI